MKNIHRLPDIFQKHKFSYLSLFRLKYSVKTNIIESLVPKSTSRDIIALVVFWISVETNFEVEYFWATEKDI